MMIEVEMDFPGALQVQMIGKDIWNSSLTMCKFNTSCTLENDAQKLNMRTSGTISRAREINEHGEKTGFEAKRRMS